MSLSPVSHNYECNKCGASQILFIDLFGAAPRFIKCNKCRCPIFSSELKFPSKLAKNSYQKKALRKAGVALVRAADNAPKKEKEFASSLRQAGELLREMP